MEGGGFKEIDPRERATFFTEICNRIQHMIPPEHNAPENVDDIAESLEADFFDKYKGNSRRVTDSDIRAAIKSHLGK